MRAASVPKARTCVSVSHLLTRKSRHVTSCTLEIDTFQPTLSSARGGIKKSAHVRVEFVAQDPSRRLRGQCLRPALDRTGESREDGKLDDLPCCACSGWNDRHRTSPLEDLWEAKAIPPLEFPMPNPSESKKTWKRGSRSSSRKTSEITTPMLRSGDRATREVLPLDALQSVTN